METRALTFSEMVALPGMLGRVVPVALAHGKEFCTATTRYVNWFDVAMAQAKKSKHHAEAMDELCRLVDAAQ